MTSPLLAAPLIVAHRGASHDAPENTLAAFRLAWQQGADAIEGDFYLTKDQRIVCIHDRTTKRTADADLKVAESTLEQLRALDAGSWKGRKWRGERIPTLEEVLATVPRGKSIFIELKSGPEIVAPLQEALARCGLGAEQTIVIAFGPEVVAETKRRLPAVKVFWLTGYKAGPEPGEWKPSVEEVLHTLKATGADGLDSEAHERVNESLARALREAHLSLHVWTVDKPVAAARFWKLGVESITTNRPQWLRRKTQRLVASAGAGG